jgi:hypothetical protein
MTTLTVATTADKPDVTTREMDALEKRVDTFLKSYVDAGLALRDIKEKRGYLLRGFETFEQYAADRFGWEWRQAQRMIAGANVALLCEAAVGEKPRVEAVARELSAITADEKKATGLLKKVQAGLKKLGKTIATATANEVKRIVETLLPMSNGNGNGHTAKAGSTAPALKLPDWVHDTCPHCGATPQSYQRVLDGWGCGSCQQPVLVGVMAVTFMVCSYCDAPVAADADFCPKCGEAL